MNTVEIKESFRKDIQKIRECAGDYEVAHGLEDKLYKEFVEFVANDKWIDADTREMAKEVLKVKDIEFARYCA